MTFEIQEFEKFPADDFQALKDECLSFHPFLRWDENLSDAGKAKHEQLKQARKGD